jgi:hypothetical protein
VETVDGTRNQRNNNWNLVIINNSKEIEESHPKRGRE